MERIIVILIMLSTCLNGQEVNNYATITDSIEKDILSYDNRKALSVIDSVLVNDYNTLAEVEKISFLVLKIEALTKANLFSESLILSNEILSSPILSKKQRVRILLNNALAYEYVGDFPSCKTKLDEIKALYNDGLEKDVLYAQYLYRTSSYYRVQGKYDDLAYNYAERAMEFSEKNNYKSEAAVSSMLLGFLDWKKSPFSAEKHFMASLKFWEEVGDTHGTSSMYISLSDIEGLRGNFSKALALCDKAILAEKGSERYGGLAYSHFKKGQIFKKIRKLDSAIVYIEKQHDLELKGKLIDQQIKTDAIRFEADIINAKLRNKDLLDALNKRKGQQKVLLGVLGSIFLLGSIFAYLSFRLKKKNNQISYQKKLLDDSLSQQKILLKELHHRVKNNLAMIISLIKLQSFRIKESDRGVLDNLEKRIKTIAIAHDQFLYSEDSSKYSIAVYIDKIVKQLIALSPREINVHQEIDDFNMSLDSALPIGIIINELVTNSIKYAATEDVLELKIKINVKDNIASLSYEDNGKPTDNQEESSSLGMTIINAMTKQLKGKCQKDNFKYDFVLHLRDV